MTTNKTLFGLAAVIALIVVGASGYYLGRQADGPIQIGQDDQQATTTPDNQVATATTTQNLPTKEEVKTWKTYTFGGVAFKYPIDWKADAGFYYSPAGEGGQDSVIFSPVNIDIKTDTSEKIIAGGHQQDCAVLTASAYRCETIADLPIYTKSTSPEVLAAFRAITANAVNLQEFGWKTYIHTSGSYQINYPAQIVVKLNQNYPPLPSSTARGTVFEFPKQYYQSSTIKSIKAGIVTTKASCSLMADGAPWRGEALTSTQSGAVFDVRKMTDAGAGNYYVTTEYNMMRNGQCYRIGMLIHGTNPGNTYTDRATIEAATELNNLIQTNVESILRDMVSTFAITL